MSEEQKPKEPEFEMFTDHPTRPTLLTIRIPVEEVAKKDDMSSYFLMLGFLENAKDEAKRMVGAIHKARTVVKPAPVIIPHNSPLRVHK